MNDFTKIYLKWTDATGRTNASPCFSARQNAQVDRKPFGRQMYRKRSIGSSLRESGGQRLAAFIITN